ncbi:MAG: hypothetical protein EPN91_13140 [Salinibacterium sp.]|nr:MAG: hypothetical protein EPN91_13140 [Salinibacterium sp.]
MPMTPEAELRLQNILNDPAALASIAAILNVGMANTAYLDDVYGNDSKASVGSPVPFKTFQAAVNALRTAYLALGTRKAGMVLVVAPFTEYDENVTIDVSDGFKLLVTSDGGYNIGKFDAASVWGPSVRRDLIIIGDAGNGGATDIRPGIMFGTRATRPAHVTTHQAYYGPRISGQINFDGLTAGNLEFTFEGEVYGMGGIEGASNIGNQILSLYLHNCRFRTAANFGTNSNLFQGRLCRFDGLLTIGQASDVVETRINAGLTVGSVGSVPPIGFFNSFLDGAFTGPATAWIRLDLASNTTFVANGNGPIVGGGSKLLLNDATL